MLISGKDTLAEGSLYEVSDVFTSDRTQIHPTAWSSPSLAAINSSPQVRKIRHHIANKFGAWKPSNVEPHGKILLTASISQSAQEQLQLQPIVNAKETVVNALADTGAQMCVADWLVATRMNIRKQDLLTPALTVSVADNANLELMGAQFLTLTAPTGQITQQLVYFAKGVGEFYLSKSALTDLQVISKNFPMVGDCQSGTSQGAIYEVQDGFPSVLHEDNRL